MLANFLKSAINRHLEETKAVVEQLTDDLFDKQASEETRKTAEIILHMIRSFEFYSRGLSKGEWIPAPYTLEKYNTAKKVVSLYNEVVKITNNYLEDLTDKSLQEDVEGFNRVATKGEILLELLEHSIHHRGQLAVYYRLSKKKPAEIKYII
ncbi:MAG: DinB family protein [Asgard group archaeon]|nr:DinB family protein [Asgard group archaeon]